MKKYLVVGLFSLIFCAFLSADVFAQRDYFTAEEVELIRGAQEIDRRIEVLTQIIDRRFHVLQVDVSAPKTKTKGEWGELPQGTRPELFLDIRRILQKAVDDIDSLAERPESAILPDPDAKKKDQPTFATLFPKAVRSLAAAAGRYAPALEKELGTTTDHGTKGSVLAAIDLCHEIIASVAKLPAEQPKKKGKS